MSDLHHCLRSREILWPSVIKIMDIFIIEDQKTLIKMERDMNIVITGHVDHGKSTVIGRLLADTGSLPEGKLEQIREKCKRNSRPFEYAFLLDALKDEQAQGITIDSARCFFKTKKRGYTIIDVPGHIEFLKNMVTGASRAQAALLVIDAQEGIKENSKRHGYLLSILGIDQLVVLVNKMDLMRYEQKVYENICREYKDFLSMINIEPGCFIPVSGIEGDNISFTSESMDWYKGKTVLEILDDFESERSLSDKPFRLAVQGVYKFTTHRDDRRIIAGTVNSGRLCKGDSVVFFPSGKKSRIASIETFNKEPQIFTEAGNATGFTLSEQIYVKRGELAAKEEEPKPRTGKRMLVSLFWLGMEPMEKGRKYHIKIGTAKVPVFLEEVIHIIDASTLKTDKKYRIDRHDVSECILCLEKAVAYDLVSEIMPTGRFVIVDDNEIAGGGIVKEALDDKETWIREKVITRNFKWENSRLSPEERAEKYNQKATLILITGQKDAGKKPIAKALEKKLFNDGRIVYFIGIANVLYGVDADIKNQTDNNREEHFRRLSEIAYLMLDAGCILIVTVREATSKDLEIMRTVIDPEKIQTVWIGKNVTTDLECDLHIADYSTQEEAAKRIRYFMRDKGIVFKPC